MVRIGITGVPGVESTFIEAFGTLDRLGKKWLSLLLILAAPTHGSILGDKTRMEELKINAFIRPSVSGTTLGGVARKTRETITL
jgi:LAO/AO transport system kinase